MALPTQKMFRHMIILGTLVLPLSLGHATVRPEVGTTESKVGASETYRLQVPNEKAAATTEVRLLMPEGFTYTRAMPMPGWERSVEKAPSGRVISVTWRGKIEDGEFERFIFQGRNPASSGTLTWKVYQHYDDGTIVAWDDSSNATPASKTEIR